jgi:secreted PhoX family phosphatase
VQNDSAGNVWLVEDIGGAGISGGKKPNSYVYRFTPTTPTNLSAGTLEALQVSRKDDTPVTAQELTANPSDAFITDLHTYGSSFATRWVPLTLGVNNGATAAAAAAGATPFKRPENGVFRPGANFGDFYFTETGDTNKDSTLPGAFGGVFKLSQTSPSASTGTLSPAYLGDLQHTGLDNIQFASKDQLLVVEDAGDSLHTQRNALDSAYLIDLKNGSGKKAPSVVRWLAEGRDASATYDHYTNPGYNDGDNEITGIHVSNGDPSTAGILGAQVPQLVGGAWRAFWTQQHGDNITWEVRVTSGDATGQNGDNS